MSDNVNKDELLFESTINKLGDTRSYTKWENNCYFRAPSGRASPRLSESDNLGDTLKLPTVTAGGRNRTLTTYDLRGCVMGWAYVLGMDFTYSVWILRTRHGFYVIGMDFT